MLKKINWIVVYYLVMPNLKLWLLSLSHYKLSHSFNPFIYSSYKTHDGVSRFVQIFNTFT